MLLSINSSLLNSKQMIAVMYPGSMLPRSMNGSVSPPIPSPYVPNIGPSILSPYVPMNYIMGRVYNYFTTKPNQSLNVPSKNSTCTSGISGILLKVVHSSNSSFKFCSSREQVVGEKV